MKPEDKLNISILDKSLAIVSKEVTRLSNIRTLSGHYWLKNSGINLNATPETNRSEVAAKYDVL